MTRHRRHVRWERVVAGLALLLIAFAWVLGAVRAELDLMPFVRQAVPEAGHIVRQDNGLYAAWTDARETGFVGFVATSAADGYGGPLRVAVAADPTGEIIGAVIVDDKETPAWMDRVVHSGLLRSLVGKSYSDGFEVGTDVDGVTGATNTSKALAEAARTGSRTVARRLDLPVEDLPPPAIVFGVPEVVLLALFAVGYFGHQGRFRFARQARWVSMLVGMVVLGFLYNLPLTLAYITKLLLGYWPQWQTNLYWYFLIGGILFVFTVDNKNPYCRWFCPFGAAQECMGVIGGARSLSPGRFVGLLKWLQRLLALAAILLGVYLRSPGLASYELFGTLFDLLGSSLQFAALGLVLIAALFITRPWCNYLCPIRPVVDYIQIVRELVKERWRKIRTEPA
ncbi:MAG: FMN-binding protein [Acidobacteria bacterium]|nr:FMN-binding protein [Candidatus Sulfomarinibacter sp. MAG AM1]